MIRGLILGCSLLLVLSSCGGGQHKSVNVPIVKNPYVQQAKDFTHFGIESMYQERWSSAEHAFKRALDTAQLANDAPLIVRAWYNIAMLYRAKHEPEAQLHALQKTQLLAQEEGFSDDVLRAQLQIQLLEIEQGQATTSALVQLPQETGLDIVLLAARVQQLQGKKEQAKDLYQRVISTASQQRSDLLYQAEAYMGLALLAAAEADIVTLERQIDAVLKITHKVGAPRLTANALLLRAKAAERDQAMRLRDLEKSLSIYEILRDKRGIAGVQAVRQSLANEQ